ncbi:MAG: leucine-rich repeat protein, partial [Bacteroidaceae bacterium]|nr:leucine-rich repeat protein [Bacteroidaceae bacterium]
MPAEKPVESFEKTGTCGDGMKWRYDTIARTMTISGDGYIADYKTVGDIWTGLETNTPWNEFSDSIETVIVEEGVKGLGKYAFWDCDSLTTVILPSSCTDYGQSSFADCSSLQTVVVAARNIWQANSYSFSNYDKCTLYVPKDLVDYYKKEIPFNEFSNIVGIYFVKIDENIVNGTIVPERYYFKDGEQVNLTPKPKNNFIVESVIVNGDTLKESTDGFVVSGINADLFISATFDVANSGQCGDSLTWAFDKAAKKLVISGNGAMPDYTASNMPWKYFKEHYGIEVVEISQGVTAVGSNAFNGCVGLDSVFISNTVASIGSNAFSGCSSLTSVTIPNTVASIGDGAFSGVNVVGYGGSATGSPWGASKMVNGVVDGDFVYSNAQKDTLIAYIGTGGNVAIPNTVANIGISAFYGCTALTSVIIPNSVTSIGNCAFDGCSGLTSVEIPNSVTSIGNEAFDGCKGLTSVTIPNSVTSIGKSAFYECSSLTSVSIPEGVTSIEYCAFYNCKELTSVSIPGSVTTIDENAFEWCSKITSLTIPNGDLKSIGNFAFHACKGLTSLTIPDSVQSIGKCAFYECSGLTSITIPANLTSIGISAFYGCKGLTSVVVNMDEPLSIESSVFENVTLSNVKLFVPVGTKEKYEAADVWKDFDIVEGSLIQVALTSNDEAYGSVAGSGLYVENETIALSATPAVGCQFVKWSDGNTDNPRTITLTENVTLEAIFEKADAISSNAVSNMKIYAHHNVIVVENAEAEISVYDVTGRCIAKRLADGNRIEIAMQREGIYIVRTGGYSQRVVVSQN